MRSGKTCLSLNLGMASIKVYYIFALWDLNKTNFIEHSKFILHAHVVYKFSLKYNERKWMDG